MVFSSRSANRTKAPKGAAAPWHLALLFAKFTTECATSLLQGGESLTHSSAKTHSTSRALKALSIASQCSPRNQCLPMNTMTHKAKPRNKQPNTPKSQGFASWRRIKWSPWRAASSNWQACPQLENFSGLWKYCFLSSTGWAVQVFALVRLSLAEPFPWRWEIRGLWGQCCMQKKARFILTAFQTKAYQFWDSHSCHTGNSQPHTFENNTWIIPFYWSNKRAVGKAGSCPRWLTVLDTTNLPD